MTNVKPSAGRRTLLSRADLGVFAALLATAVFVGVTLVRAPRIVGAVQDDGIYLTTAKALATGQGYRHLELPGQPYQTKYPILYPLLLSVVWRAWPDFPDNVAAIQVVNTALWALGSWIAYRLMRRVWCLPWWLSASGVILAFAHGQTMGLLQTAMAEPLFFVLVVAALSAVSMGNHEHRSPEADPRAQAEPAPTEIARSALAGVLAGGAYLTRTLGLALVAAILLDLLVRRRWKQAAVAAIGPALAIGGWRLWCAHAAALNAADPVSAAFRYDLNYGMWFPSNLGTVLWVAGQNVTELALAAFLLLIPPPHNSWTDLLQRGFVGAIPLYVVMLTVMALIVGGAVAVFRRSRAAVHLYLALYLALVLIWPFHPKRFLVPLLPLSNTCILVALYLLVVQAAGLVAGRTEGASRPNQVSGQPQTLSRWRAERPGARLALGLVLVLAGGVAYHAVRMLTLNSGGQLQKAERQREAFVELLRERTPPDAVICSDAAGYLHLRTGRKVIPFLPWEDPIALAYPPDRSFLACGQLPSRGEAVAHVQRVNQYLAGYLRSTGATFVVPPREDNFYGAAFAELRRRRPQSFPLVQTIEPYSLYRVIDSTR
jgi:hypothetical protein